MAGIRNRTVELKSRLSEYVRMVRSGAHVQVTVMGQVVAELGSPGVGRRSRAASRPGGAPSPGPSPGRSREFGRSLFQSPAESKTGTRQAAPRRRSSGTLIVSAESSAVVAWLLGGPSGLAAREALATAEAITASDSPRQRRRGAGPPDQMHAPSPGPGEAD